MAAVIGHWVKVSGWTRAPSQPMQQTQQSSYGIIHSTFAELIIRAMGRSLKHAMTLFRLYDTGGGSKLRWHSYRNGPIYKVRRICQHAIELWLVVLCAVGAQPDDTNWIWDFILFSVWTLRWKPANTAQLKAVVSCLKYISYRVDFPSGERVFPPIRLWWWNCQRDCLLLATFLIAKNLSNYLAYSSDWILPTRKYTSPFSFLVRTLKRKRTRRVPYFIPFNWRIKKFIKRKNWKSFVLSPHLKPPFF